MVDAGRPDIVLVTVDSLRLDAVGCYEAAAGERLTPRIDALADDGARFESAISNAPNTIYSFLASLTSTYPLEGPATTEGRPYLPELLAEHGYTTAAFHSNPFLSEGRGFDRGFETFVDFQGDSEPEAVGPLRRLRARAGQLLVGGLRSALRPFPYWFDLARETKNYLSPPYARAAEVNEAAAAYLDRHRGDGPHFLWVHYMDTHHPYLPVGEYRGRFVPDLGARELVRLAVKIDQVKREDREEPVSEADLDRLWRLYRAQVAHVDDAIGTLLSYLRSVGRYEDAIVVAASDHGDEFMEHGMLGHCPQLYDELIHVPLVLKPPGGEPVADRVEGQFALLDLAPTLLEAAGIDRPERMRGLGQWEAIGSGQTDRDEVIAEYAREGERITAVRTERWKYVQDDIHGREELYDLEADPLEAQNLVDHERRNRVDERDVPLGSFRQRLADHLAATAADQELVDTGVDAATRSRLEDLGYL